MQISALINGNMPGALSYISLTATQKIKTPKLPLDQQCQGYKTQFSACHTAQRNVGCAIQACCHVSIQFS
jgi:hypothetical protein